MWLVAVLVRWDVGDSFVMVVRFLGSAAAGLDATWRFRLVVFGGVFDYMAMGVIVRACYFGR